MNNCQASFRQALKALGVYFKDMGRASYSIILRKSGESRNTSSKGAGREPADLHPPLNRKRWTWNYLFLLTHIDAAGVGWIAAVE